MSFALKGTTPKLSKNNNTPRLQTSLLTPTSPSAFITSGARYAGVPPVSYIFLLGSIKEEIPKSQILGLNYLSSKMLSNLMSRCIILF